MEMAKILVIDDEEFFRTFLGELFTRNGHEVFQASTGGEALALVETARPHVVLLDFSLVGETGLDILIRLKRRFPDIPVIMVTGQTRVEAAVDLVKAGACDYVAKPFVNEVLLKKVRLALEGHLDIQ